MSTIGWIHTACAVAALLAGAAVLLRPKGTPAHRRLGWLYVGSMAALNLTALLIYRLTGRVGPFHAAAILSLATVVAGVLAVRRRPAGRWVERHYYWMTYSYVGLLAAAASEAATRLAAGVFWWAVLAASTAVFAAGAVLVARRAPAALAPFRLRAVPQPSPIAGAERVTPDLAERCG